MKEQDEDEGAIRSLMIETKSQYEDEGARRGRRSKMKTKQDKDELQYEGECASEDDEGAIRI